MKKHVFASAILFLSLFSINHLLAAPLSCSAEFSFFVDGGTVHFDGTGTGISPTYIWNFGDGTSATGEDPVYTYASNGIYYVCLSVWGADSCFASYCDSVFITGLPAVCNAEFSATITGTSVHFNNASDLAGALTASYMWNFGDGGTSTAFEPDHDFAPGIYTVCLDIITADGCTSDFCEAISIGGGIDSTESCAASFDFTTDIYTAYFNNTSDGGGADITGYTWNFGDGSFSTEENPEHTYPTDGTYTVCLDIVTADSCTSEFCSFVHAGVIIDTFGICGAMFTYTIDGTTVHFEDASTGGGAAITYYNWNFGDGFISAFDNPDHTYAEPGYYIVCLTIFTDDSCASFYCQDITIDITDSTSCNADFAYSFDGDNVVFDNNSSAFGAAASYYWDFGDASTTTLENPTHTYFATGDYDVCLTIYTDSCTDTYCQVISFTTGIDALSEEQNILISPNPAQNNCTIIFMSPENTSGTIWVSDLTGRKIQLINDGIFNSGENIFHADTGNLSAGIYMIQLELSDGTKKSSRFIVTK